MSCRLATACAVVLGLAIQAGQARAYCAPENSPCYRWFRYSYNGATWCRHWNFGTYEDVYCINSTAAIGPVTFRDLSAAAYQGWKSAAFSLPQMNFTALSPIDTGSVSYFTFIDDATWIARSFNPSAGALTYHRVYVDGTIAHGRTWFHLKPATWGWSPDCLNNNCASNPPFSPGLLDFPSIAAHELGHWWQLLDISTAGCEPILMWYQTSLGQVRRTPQFSDAYGATLLYDQPVDALVSLFDSDIQPDRVSLAWYTSDRASAVVTVERRAPSGDWEPRALISADGAGYLRFNDISVASGERWGYRLRIPGAMGDVYSAETWVDVPLWALAIAPSGPNPSRGADLRVRFVLPTSERASLDVVDIAGRRVRQAEVGSLGRGAHVLSLGADSPLRPGLYWLRLRQGARSATARTVIIQ